jgi:hypothetical protein
MDDFSPKTDEFCCLRPSYLVRPEMARTEGGRDDTAAEAALTLITLKWAPPLVQGLVRDLCVR